MLQGSKAPLCISSDLLPELIAKLFSLKIAVYHTEEVEFYVFCVKETFLHILII